METIGEVFQGFIEVAAPEHLQEMLQLAADNSETLAYNPETNELWFYFHDNSQTSVFLKKGE